MSGHVRRPYDEFVDRIGAGDFVIPHLVHRGGPLSVDDALSQLADTGKHGATETVEGAIWRVERSKSTGRKGDFRRIVDYLVKYVRPSKVDGKYLPELSGEEPIWLWRP